MNQNLVQLEHCFSSKIGLLENKILELENSEKEKEELIKNLKKKIILLNKIVEELNSKK